MPKQNVTLNDFSGGLVDTTNPRDIPDNALSEADNVSFTERQSIKTLGGVIAHKALFQDYFSGATGADGTGSATVLEGHIAGGYGMFAFESDYDIGLTTPSNQHTSGSEDQGSQYILYMDCLNAAFHMYDYNTRTLNLVNTGNDIHCAPNDPGIGWGGREVEHWDFSSNKLEFGQHDSVTPSGRFTGDFIKDDDNSFVGKVKAGDYIRIENCDDNSNANNFQCLRVRDVNRTQITVDHKDIFTNDANESGSPKIHVLVKPVYYYAENAVRISDASFWETKCHTNVDEYSAFQNCWFGHIKRTHFHDANGATILSTTSNATFDGWFLKNNKLSAPTALTVSTSSTYPSGSGTGFHLRLTGDAALSGSSWTNVAYQCAVSFIYDGNQESLLYIPTSNHTFTPSAANRRLNFELYANANYDPRITGARIYARQNDTENDWTLLIESDLSKGNRTTLSEPYLLWDDTAHASNVTSGNLYSSDINLETYEILNGFSPNEQKITVSGNGEGYKTAVVANRRAFIANIRTENEEGVVKQMRDRIMYSPPGKFDTFPRSFFIDAVKGDAGEYVKLESFGDRLLAFKQEKLFIINISAPNPANWFLEQVKDFTGCRHPHAVQKAEFGIMWANEYGFWMYDGQSVRNLISGKINEPTWEDFFTNGTIVGYNAKDNYALILKDSVNASGTNILIYDYRTGGWTNATNSIYTVASDYANGSVITNMILDPDNNLSFGIQRQAIGNDVNDTTNPDEVITFHQWDESINKGGLNAADCYFVTKDLDFGNPARVKRFYKVIITYKATASLTTPISYSVNGGDTYTNLTGNFANTSGAWDILTATPSVPFEGQSLKIKVKGAPSNGVEINDISIEFRTLLKNPT